MRSKEAINGSKKKLKKINVINCLIFKCFNFRKYLVSADFI